MAQDRNSERCTRRKGGQFGRRRSGPGYFIAGAGGPAGPAGLQGFAGPPGQRGATGLPGPASGLSDYAYVYNTCGQGLAIDADVVLASNGPISAGITHCLGGAAVTIFNAGDYKGYVRYVHCIGRRAQPIRAVR
jgi:hypothetical protein